jgi:hypothetical protein
MVVFDVVILYVVEFPIFALQFDASQLGAFHFAEFQFGVFHAANAVCTNAMQISIPTNRDTTFIPVFLLIFSTPILNHTD